MKLDSFTLAYIECMLWAETDQTNDQGGDPLEDNYGIEDFAPETLESIVDDCVKFQSLNEADINGDYDLAGHDFWLTRVGHGAGFWDGDWPEDAGQRLTKSSKSFGHVNVYVGDDNKLYLA